MVRVHLCIHFTLQNFSDMARTANIFAKPKMTVEQVANVAAAAGRIVTAFENADTNQDGKRSVAELAVASLGELSDIAQVAGGAKDAFTSFRAFPVADRKTVIGKFAETFDLQNDVAEERIEVVFFEANIIVSGIANILAAFKKRQAVPIEG